MDPNEFNARLAALDINRAEAARLLGVHASSVLRFASGRLEIPRYVERGLENVERLREAGIPPSGADQVRPVGRPRRTKRPTTSRPPLAQLTQSPDIAAVTAELQQVQARLTTVERHQQARQTAYDSMITALIQGLERVRAESFFLLDKPLDELEEHELFDPDPYGSNTPARRRPKPRKKSK